MKESLKLKIEAFLPQNYIYQLEKIQSVNSISKEILEGNFDEASSDHYVTNELRKTGEKLEDIVEILLAGTVDNFTKDFNNRFQSYSHIALTSETEIVFPFKEWAKSCFKLEELNNDSKVILSLKQVLDFFVELGRMGKLDLLKELIANYLDSSIDRNARNSYHLGLIDFTIEKIFPNVSLAQLLLCSNENEYIEVLNGKTINGSNHNRIIEAGTQLFTQNKSEFEDINEAFDEILRQEYLTNSNISLENKLRKFKSSEIWHYISNNELALTQFCRQFTENAMGLAHFFEVSKNIHSISKKNVSINDIKVGKLPIFFKEVIQGDKVSGNYILDLLAFKIQNEKVRLLFIEERKEIEKIMSYFHLKDNLKEKPLIEKKIKL